MLLKKHLLLSIFTLIFGFINSQTITTTPSLPKANEEITLIFNATGTGLEGYTGNVYAHTGVTTEDGQWQYVIGTWGTNSTQPLLTKLATDRYQLTITPSIMDYYIVADDETVSELCFVFRSSDGSSQTSDLFIDIYQDELSVSIVSPDDNLLIDANSSIKVNVAASNATSLTLYVDDQAIQETTDASISTTITSKSEGKHWIWAKASDETNSVYDSVYYFIKEEQNISELPTGVVKGINYINDSTVTLVLYAPNKEYVYLIGDFNDWDISNTLETTFSDPTELQVTSTTWLMNKTNDNNYYWKTIDNVQANKEYAFQYWIDGDIVIADPYTEKILDPWNDEYITDDVYPNLKAYPEDKTSEPVSVFQTAQEKYNWKVTDFTPANITDMVVYEMHIRDFVAAHTFGTITDTLDYLKRLGINVLELMPINEFEGNSSWGYNPSFYFAPDKYYGPKNDLKILIDSCHSRGIAVVIDLVLNHSYGQSPFLRMYFDGDAPTEDNPWYNVTSPNTTYYWGYDFNHESEDTKELVDSINSFWLTQYNVDGFRFDFTKGFTNTVGDGYAYDESRIAILERIYNHIKSVNPNAYVILEHLTANSEEKELANYGMVLWGNMNTAYCEAAMGWNDNSDLSWISYQNRGWDTPHVVGYMESHDEERLMYKNLQYGNADGDYNITNLYTALNRIELAANFFLTIPGPKMIWQFGELGYDYSIDYNERTGEKPICWDYQNSNSRQRVYDVFAALNKLRFEEDAFETTDYDISLSGATKSIHLNHTDMNVVVLGNFDVVEQSIDPEFQGTGTWYEYYTGEALEVSDVNMSITLNPGEYRIYTTKQLEVPEINNEISSISASSNQLFIYPNPASSQLYIKNINNYKNISIYNSLGQLVWQNSAPDQINNISIHNLKQGVYLLNATDLKGNKLTRTFIKE